MPRKRPIYRDLFKPIMVGMTGFEPAASWSRTKRSTKLSHIPTSFADIILAFRAEAVNRSKTAITTRTTGHDE